MWSHGVNSNFAFDFREPGAYPKVLLMCLHIFLFICSLFVPVYSLDLLFL